MDARPDDWWRGAVFYQIYIRSFADSNNDGIGDIAGITRKLDYLNDGTPSSLGVDALWLTPVFSSPDHDWGYDISDYRSIHRDFGSMDDFDRLVEECHRRGIKVIIDMVLNHTSIEHPWFQESRSSRDNPRRDWYIWRDGRAPGKPPNRWKAVVEGSAWQYDQVTGQYYYHAFLEEQPDLNWRNPEVRRAMLDNCRFWLDRGIDGFRLDLVNFLHEDEQLRDNPRRIGLRGYDMQKHLYDRSQQEDHEVLRELRGMLDERPGTMMVGEVVADSPEEVVRYLGSGSDELHLSFLLAFGMGWWSAGRFRRLVEAMERLVPEAGWPCYHLSNHDVPRHFSRLGKFGDAEARARAAAVMLLTLRGTAFLYYGEEIGMPSGKVPRRMLRDPVGIRFWPLPVGRDSCRTPMPWGTGLHASFSEAEPWLPVDASSGIKNVALQQEDPGSLMNFYRQLIRLRREVPALHRGDYRTVTGCPGRVFAFLREANGVRVAVYINFSSRVVSCREQPLPRAGHWEVLLSSRDDRCPGATTFPVELKASEALVIRETQGGL